MARFHPVRFQLSLATLLALVAVACGPSAAPAPRSAAPQAAAPAAPAALAPAAPAKPPATEQFTFQLPWKAGGTYSAFYLAAKKGYYAEQGLVVDIVEGRGSATTAKVVGAGTAPLGYAEGGVVIQSVTEDVPIKAVAAIMQKSPASVMFPKSLGINTPKDLEGKKFAAAPASSTTILLDPWLRINGVDPATVQIVSTSPQTILTVLLQGQADVASAFYSDNVPVLQSRGMDAGYLLYADYGLNVPGSSIIVNNAFASEKPDVVRRFVAAALRGHIEAQRDPAASVASIADLATSLDTTLETAALTNVLNLLHTERSQGKPLGWMAKEDWEDGINILFEYAGLKSKPKVEEVITNDFLPAQ